MTHEVLSAVESAASRGLTDRQIGEFLGVSRATISRRKSDSEAFDTAIKKGRAQGIERVANALFQQALEGNTTAAIFYLKCRGGWSEKADLTEFLPTPVIKIVYPDDESEEEISPTSEL